MQHKMNPAILQKALNAAHADISPALLYLARVVGTIDPGSGRAGLNEIQMQFEQIFTQTIILNRRIRRWALTYPELTEGVREDKSDFLAEFFDFHGEAEEEAAEADDEEEAREEDRADDSDECDADDDAAETPQPGAVTSADVLADADLARLFGISEASATAGVQETGYLDIFGAWIEGRRPGPYKRPQSPEVDEDPDYNDPNEDA